MNNNHVNNEADEQFDVPVEIPINGELDLHAFSPKDVKDVVKEYMNEAYRLGIYDIRIIHGKGTGVLREIVHSVLKKSEIVENYKLGDSSSGQWGATIVVLKKNN